VQRRGDIDGAVIGRDAFVLRFFSRVGDDRLLIVNFGTDLALDIAPEPLLAPPLERHWGVMFSTEDPKYGGSGSAPVVTEAEGWFLPGRCAVVAKPLTLGESIVQTRHRVAGSAQDAKVKSPCE
jgi:maltooligosyltrehalose trehalohydrolase